MIKTYPFFTYLNTCITLLVKNISHVFLFFGSCAFRNITSIMIPKSQIKTVCPAVVEGKSLKKNFFASFEFQESYRFEQKHLINSLFQIYTFQIEKNTVLGKQYISGVKEGYLPGNKQYWIEDQTPKCNSFILSGLPSWKRNKNSFTLINLDG